MSKFKAPLLVHSGEKIRITNTFGKIEGKELQAWYKKMYNITEHLGIDIRLTGKRRKSYGTPILSLFAGTVYYEQFYSAFGKKSNGLRIVSDDLQWRARYWHNSKHLVHYGDHVEQYQPISLMGNSGNVRPEPTYADPYGGVHLHLTLEKNIKNRWVKVDPLLYVDLSDFIRGEDTSPDDDVPPLAWVVSQISEMVGQLAISIGLFKKKREGYEV